MKRFTSLMLMLLVAVTTWAQLTTGQYYKIKNVDADLYLHVAGDNANMQLRKESASVLQLFQLEEAADGQYYIKSVKGETTYYVHASGWDFNATTTAENKTPYTINLVEGETDVYSLYQTTATYTGYAGADATAAGSPVYCNKDNAVKWAFEAVTVEEAALETGKKYRLRSDLSGLYMQCVDYTQTSDEGAYQLKTKSSDEGQIFELEDAGDNKFYLKNVNEETTYYVMAKSWNLYASTEATTPFTIQLLDGEYSVFSIYQNTGFEGYAGNKDNSYNAADGTKIYCNQPDLTGCTTWFFEEVNVEYTITYDFQYNGKTVYTQIAIVAAGAEYPAFTYVLPYGVTANVPVGAPTANETVVITCTLDETVLPFTVSTLENDGSFGEGMHWYTLTLRGSDLTYDAANNKSVTADVAAKTPANFYAFTGNPFDGYKLFNYAAGSSKIAWSATVDNSGAAIPFTELTSVTENTDWLLFANGDGYTLRRKDHDNGYINDRGNALSYWISGSAATDDGSRLTIDEVTDDVLAEFIETYKTTTNATLDEWANLSVVFDAELIATAKAAVSAVEADGIATFATIDSKLTDVTDAVAAKMFTFQTTATDNGRNGVWVSANATTMKAIGADAQDYNAIWSLRHASGTSFYMYNELNSVYMGAPSSNCPLTATPSAAYTFEIVDAENSIVEMHTNGETMHASNLTDDTLLNYDEDQAASRWYINSIDGLTGEEIIALDALQEAYNAKAFYADAVMGDGLGEYTGDKEAIVDALPAAEAIVSKTLAEQAALSVDEITLATNALNNVTALEINMPAEGKYYRIKGACDATLANYYITGNTNSDGGRIACKADADASTIFFYNDGKLLAYNSGLYIGVNSSNYKFSSVDGTTPATEITFAGSPRQAGAYTVKSADRFLFYKVYNGTVELDRYQDNTSTNLDWTLEEVTELPVTVTAAGYATLYAPVALTVPTTGVTAHTVTLNGEWATLSEALEVIPANTGVVLAGEGSHSFAITTSDPFEGENALEGTVATTHVDKDAYVLSYIDTDEDGAKDEVGFYTATKNQAENTAFQNNSHKAYLVVPAELAEGIAYYSFRFGEGTTGIDEITENRVQSTVIYDLTGRRVEAITAPGIYIVGGKKVLVK